MTRTMYDSIDINALPADAQMVAGYIDGMWPTFANLTSRFPNAVRVSITTSYTGTPGAHVIDCETGDSTPQTAAAWAEREVAAGRQPTIYCNGSTWPTVQTEVAKLGITGRVNYWIAIYDGIPTIPPGAIGKQYRSDTNQNLDYSVVADYWPGVDQGGDMPLTTADEPIIVAAVQAALNSDEVFGTTSFKGTIAHIASTLDAIFNKVNAPPAPSPVPAPAVDATAVAQAIASTLAPQLTTALQDTLIAEIRKIAAGA